MSRRFLIEILSILSLVFTVICISIEGLTLASIFILVLEIPYIILLLLEGRKDRKSIIENQYDKDGS